MVSECVNKTLFLYRDGVRLHRMKFYIYECTERDDLKSMIQERCGIVAETKGEHVVCFATQCLDLEDGEIFSTEFIKQCCENNMLLDLKNFRLGKNPDCSNVDPLDVLKGIASWPQNIRCSRNSRQNNSVNKLKETQDSELSAQKRKRSIRKKNEMEQERRLCCWRQAYSREEDMKIIRYLLKNNNYKKSGTNTLWKKMELQEVLRDRSWQSMKNRLRIIRLHPERYDLSDEDIKKLGGKTAVGSSNSLKVSVDKNRCCFCCPKMDVDGSKVANGRDNIKYSCHCSQRMKRQAETCLQNEALVQVESIGRKFSCSVQSQAKPNQDSCVTREKPHMEKSFSYSNSTPSGDETETEGEPEHCFKDTSTPFHKTRSKPIVKNGEQPNHRRKLYILPSSDINVSIKSRDISLLKNKRLHKKFSIPLRWPQRFTPVTSAVFEKQVTESDTVAPEVLNHKNHNSNTCPDDNGSTVYGSCQSHGMENDSATYSSKSMLSGEGIKAVASVNHLTNVKFSCHSSKTEDTLSDKGLKTLNMKSHSTPKKLLQIFNKRKESIVSPSYSTSDKSSGFGLQMGEERSTNHVNECINDQMSSEYHKLQTNKSNQAQHEPQVEITNMLHSNSLQNEQSSATQRTPAQDTREKDISASPTHHQEHSNSKQQCSSGNLSGAGSPVYGDKHCQHISNYKDFYVKQWLNSVVHYYENGTLSKVPSFSEKLNEITTSSKPDNNYSKNISCDNLNDNSSSSAPYTKKSVCVNKEISQIDEQGNTDSCHKAKDRNSVLNNDFISSNSSEISVLKDKSACAIGASGRLSYRELPHISPVEESRKMTLIVSNATDTPDSDVMKEIISEPQKQPHASDSKGDNVCFLQSNAERFSSVNNENNRDEPFLRISHVASLYCEHNQEECYEESCDSGDSLMESLPSQVSSHIPTPIKQERSISITDENSILDEDSLSERRPSKDCNHVPLSGNQEINTALDDEEFRYEGYSPPVDFLSHMSDNE